MKRIFSFCMLLMLMVSTADAQSWGIVNDPDGYTNVRTGPGTSHQIIGRRLSQRSICYTPTNKSWYRVYIWDCDMRYEWGYMASSRIVPAPAGCTVYQVTASDGYVNIRKEPSSKSAIVGKEYTGRFLFASKKATNKWHKVYTTKGKFWGYAHSSQIDRETGYASEAD